MALALGSIASKYGSDLASNNVGQMADMAYIEEFRNQLDEHYSSLKSINSSSNYTPDNNPNNNNNNAYQEQFRLKKEQILQQNVLLKRFQQRHRCRQCMLWMMAVTIVATISLIAILLSERWFMNKQQDYINYFAILLVAFILLGMAVVFGTFVYNYRTRQSNNTNNQTTTTPTIQVIQRSTPQRQEIAQSF